MADNTEKKPVYKKWWFWVIIIIFIIGVVGASQTGNQDTNQVSTSTNDSNNVENTINTQENEKVEVSLEQYNQIKDGMTYEEVVEIFGGKESSSSESETAGIKSQIMMWDGNGDFSIVTIAFIDGEVYSKSQTGLE